LDVFEIEPLSDESPLWHMDNVLITPHSSGQTPEYMNRVIDIFCKNLEAYINKKQMPNFVDKRKGY
jgi:phosphoglycerate dehydrogenase-like enzyme